MARQQRISKKLRPRRPRPRHRSRLHPRGSPGLRRRHQLRRCPDRPRARSAKNPRSRRQHHRRRLERPRSPPRRTRHLGQTLPLRALLAFPAHDSRSRPRPTRRDQRRPRRDHRHLSHPRRSLRPECARRPRRPQPPPQLDRPATPAAKPARGFWTDGQRTIRTERWRLIAARAADGSPQFELFDYANDPLETRNVAAAHPAVIRDLLAQLARLPEIPAPATKASKKSKTSAAPSPL